jgi:hypothetical protein
MNVALPPVLILSNTVDPPLLVVMVALAAVLVLSNVVTPRRLLVMMALAAVLLAPVKNVYPTLLLVMVALAAVLLAPKNVYPELALLMVALAAVLLELKSVCALLLLMVALAAVLLELKAVAPPKLLMVGLYDEELTIPVPLILKVPFRFLVKGIGSSSELEDVDRENRPGEDDGGLAGTCELGRSRGHRIRGPIAGIVPSAVSWEDNRLPDCGRGCAEAHAGQ